MSIFEKWGAKRAENKETNKNYQIEKLTSDHAKDVGSALLEVRDNFDKYTPEQKGLIATNMEKARQTLKSAEANYAGGDVHFAASGVGGSNWEAFNAIENKLNAEKKVNPETEELRKAA